MTIYAAAQKVEAKPRFTELLEDGVKRIQLVEALLPQLERRGFQLVDVFVRTGAFAVFEHREAPQLQVLIGEPTDRALAFVTISDRPVGVVHSRDYGEGKDGVVVLEGILSLLRNPHSPGVTKLPSKVRSLFA